MKNTNCRVYTLFVGCALLSGCSGSSDTGNSAALGGASATTGGSIGRNTSATGGQTTVTSSTAIGGTSTTGGQMSTVATGAGGVVTGGASSSGGTNAVSGGKSSTNTASSSTGGKPTVGGTSATGGLTSSPTTTSANGTGGSSTAGGRTGNGGTASTTGPGALGGTNATGGSSAQGGTSATGGSNVQGGSNATGGITSAGGNSGAIAKANFDWVGVVGSGQSLSVGFTPVKLTTADPTNLMLKLGSTSFPGTGPDNPNVPVPGTAEKPWDSTLSDLTVVPLVEPLRPESQGYPRPYPINLWGETHHGAMARQLTQLQPGYVTVHTVVGESGKGITALNKQTGSTIGDTGRAYAATLFEAGAINRIAKGQGKTYGVGVVVMTHGETDADNTAYKDQLVQLMSDYNTDLSAITGQTYKIPMYINQQHAYPNGASSKGKRPVANNVQWQLGVDHKDDFVCTGPKYQYEANSNGDGIHLSVLGVEMLGEKTAQIFHERAVLGNDWQPLQPTGVERSGRVVTVHFHVPVPPLNWDTTFDAPAITEWKNGKGFELRSDTANITISSVEISGNDVKITASADLPTSGLHVGYAITSQGVQLKNHSKAVRWGQLRDSDPFSGTFTQQANPNYCVSFDIPVP